MENYQAAWTSNRPEDIRALFTEDARYERRPQDPQAWQGQDGIVEGWLAARDEAGDWTFSWELLGMDGDTAFIQGVTTYASEQSTYDNLWVLRLDRSGRASAFTEWFMERS